MFNPILHGLWEIRYYVGGHFVPASTLNLYNSANMPPSHQNLISNKNCGLYLSINTKNSPLNGVLLPQSITKIRTSPLKNLQAKKKEKFQILTYKSIIYLKRKLRTCTIQIQQEKVQFFTEKNIFFNFFNFRVMVRPGRKFWTPSFLKFSKKIQEMTLTGPG